MKGKLGRQIGECSLYTDELAEEICVHIVEGGTLLGYTKLHPETKIRNVYNWLRTHPDFLRIYKIAHEDQADTFADEMKEIADTPPATYTDESQVTRVDPGSVADKKLRTDVRKWLASKAKPKVYGENVNFGGNVGLEITVDRQTMLLEAARTISYVLSISSEIMKDQQKLIAPPIENGEQPAETDDA